ncbi:reverse transcriptase domain-containing protein [Tanacetum coccineum]
MRTRSSSNLIGNFCSNPTTSNPKRRNRRRSKQSFSLEESPIATMVDQRTMAELLRAPTEGYAEAIVVPPILAEHFELKHSLINMMTSDQFFRLEKDNPHDYIRWFNKITSTIKYKDVPNSTIKLMLFPFSLAGAARRWLEKEPPYSILTWEDLETSDVTTAMTTILKQFQATPPPASVKAVEEVCVTCGGAHPYYQCLAADGNTFLESGELEKIKKMNDVNIKAMQAQINNVKNELRNEMQSSIQASMSNQTNELKNMMASFFQMNTASTSGMGSLPRKTVANPKGELKSITTRSGLILDGPTVPMPPPFINLEEDERVEETLTDPEYGEFTIKVPPPLVHKAKPPYQRNYVIHQRDPRHPHIPYPSRMNQEKQKEKDEMLKSLLSNKEKLIELANTPLNENCSAVILKKLPDKLGDPGKFLIPCGFSELKCKALANLCASINLMPLSVWKNLGLPELISTQMTLELANRDICTPKGIARDVFVPVGKFTFLADFVIIDYESDPRVPLILGRPFLRTARALIDVHGEEMILHDGNERLTLNIDMTLQAILTNLIKNQST